VADPAVALEEAVELAVQVNGKVRGRISVPREAKEDEVRRLALAEPRVKELLDGKQVHKLVVVPGRLVSLVVK
jgi:leucyl-tRNA synthetase